MPRWKKVAIVGVGLIGGSIGLALRKRKLAKEVVGVGRRAASLRAAEQAGAVTATTLDLASGVQNAEFVVICTPVSGIVEQVREAALHCAAGAIITDAGSTKEHIVAALPSKFSRDVAFIGSHPMAGGEKSGPENASADLFVGRRVIVTPKRGGAPKKLKELVAFWLSLGAETIKMSPAAHDAAVAAISQTPHLIVAALAAATSLQHISLASTGFQDTTRIAAGDADLWRQILADNRDHVLKSLDKFETVLASFRQSLENDDHQKLKRLLETGKKHRDAVGD